MKEEKQSYYLHLAMQVKILESVTILLGVVLVLVFALQPTIM
jgi:hypothetical protein